MMNPEHNPYEAPAVAEQGDAPQDDGRRATCLMVLCLVDGSVKLLSVGCLGAVVDAESGFASLAEIYGSVSRGWFVAGAAFFLLETVAPWVGLYFLVQCKRRRTTFDRALWSTLLIAGAAAVITTVLLVAVLESRM